MITQTEGGDYLDTRQKLISLLESSEDYISGEDISKQLGISRAAIWKSVRNLKSEGYVIDAVTNKGYRLSALSDPLNTETINKYLGIDSDKFELEVHDSVMSTNTMLKAKADSAEDYHTIIAANQTAGRGRMGRSFYSPADSGIYLSVLLRPKLPAEQSLRITTAAAVAACRAIEACTDEKAQIKWVNDVFVRDRKVCGILTEGSFNMENGGLDWAVMGIGFNIYEPEGGFPEDIRNIAGAVTQHRKRDLKSRLAAEFLRSFHALCQDLERGAYAEEYRRRSFLIGKPVNVLRGESITPARVLDVDADCRLIVEYDDGSTAALSSGEVSVREKRN